jgi:hypothetical protein
VLCFRADGPYWFDLVHLLAYPDGVSYLWPFRYDANRIEPTLRSEVDTPGRRRALSGTRALVAARFHTAAQDRLVPIRYATIVHVGIFAGIYSFSFRLGQPFGFEGASDLLSCSVQTSQDVEHLTFRENVIPPLSSLSEGDLVGVSWKKFAQLLVRENSLPINDEARHSLFIHMGGPEDETVAAPIRRIRKTKSGEDVYGYQLKEGRKYELRYSHLVPALEGINTTVREILIEPKFAGESLEVNTTEATLIGNYGAQSLILGAASPTSIWHELRLAPKEKQLTSQDKNININTHPMRLPLAISWSMKRWFWRTLLPSMGLFVALAILGAANLVDRNLPKLLDGSITWSQLTGSWGIITLVLFGSGLASLFIPILQVRSKPK